MSRTSHNVCALLSGTGRGGPGAGPTSLRTQARPGGTVLVQTRREALVHDRWPDLVAAAEAQLPPGPVLDGELVLWGPRRSFVVRGVAAPGSQQCAAFAPRRVGPPLRELGANRGVRIGGEACPQVGG
ncbi:MULTISPECIES: hypothetical protein [unclassified Streptomyces]|uniref:hypothetical protein n=1 Tax=unclassified Streptomyces TaxID=2593676 RepID=UPI00131DE5AD|nr:MULTISPECIES: hypothetical protein [unclassified Streptomyces]